MLAPSDYQLNLPHPKIEPRFRAGSRQIVLDATSIIESENYRNPCPRSPNSRLDAISTALWRLRAGWYRIANMSTLPPARGVAIREFPLKPGHGFADYLLYLDGAAAGVVEAKKEGVALTGVELQTSKYSEGLPDDLPAPRRPLPFCYQSTGTETRFTNLLEPDARSRAVFSFHRPETLGDWLTKECQAPGTTVKARIRSMPALMTDHLWPAQIRAVQGLERSLAESRPRSLIQMATGSGKTFTAFNFIYRLVKFGGRAARPVSGRSKQPRPADAEGIPGSTARRTTAGHSLSSTTSSI